MNNRNIFFFLLFVVALLIVSCIPGVIASSDIHQKIKITQVHSYDLQHPCTYPQMVGFNSKLKTLADKGHILSNKSFFMDAKTKNVTEEDRLKVAQLILLEIKAQKPDYIYVTDDIAFELVGVPLAKAGYRVLVSGINKSISSYVATKILPQSALFNIVACEEVVYLDSVLFIFDKIRFKPYRWYILYDNTETSYYMVQNYEKELMGKGTIEPIKLTSITELYRFLGKIEDEPQSVLVLALQALFDNTTKKIIDKSVFIKYIINENKKHMELSSNLLFSKFGSAMASGPDFENMGARVGDYFVNHCFGKKWVPIIFQPITQMAINKRRLIELKFGKIVDIDIRQIQVFEDY